MSHLEIEAVPAIEDRLDCLLSEEIPPALGDDPGGLGRNVQGGHLLLEEAVLLCHSQLDLPLDHGALNPFQEPVSQAEEEVEPPQRVDEGVVICECCEQPASDHEPRGNMDLKEHVQHFSNLQSLCFNVQLIYIYVKEGERIYFDRCGV